MINNKNNRSYEISIWTLQDSFITILKAFNLEHKGQIMEPNMVLKDDGDNRFSFKIPMYIRNNQNQFIENPLWYDTINGNILVDLRKIKVIFNKNTPEQEIYEFIITNVKEQHEDQKKICEVECEGLAFHELGKQGYKITLSGYNEIDSEQKKWFENPQESGYSSCPMPNLNYWANRVFENSNWRYSIQMDYSIFDGIVHQAYTIKGEVLDSDNYINFTPVQKYDFNTERANHGLKRRDVIYEDPYVTSWRISEDEKSLLPTSLKEATEKFRMVEGKESNRYNLSQTIAEIFQVYCKYKYYYDDNYHIIDREVIFYNNFLNESKGAIDLTYKYNTENLTRVMDGTGIVTKMFVRPLSDGNMPSGETSIIDVPANKSLEDYILNFDYMYNIGTISKEQYDEVEPYLAKLHKINEEYINISNNLSIYENEKNSQEARKKGAEESKRVALERLKSEEDFLGDLTNEEGIIPITEENPQTLSLNPESGKNTYYCNFKTQGIDRDTVNLYWSYNNTSHTLGNKVGYFNLVIDEYGNLIKAENIPSNGNNMVVYATFNYRPKTYHENIIKVLKLRISKDDKIINDADTKLNHPDNGLNKSIETIKNQQKDFLQQKKIIINEFESLMGPALREGKWQPEDDYAGYGDIHTDSLQLTKTSIFNDNLSSFGWDNILIDDEQDFNFDYGIAQEKYYYPCIEITNEMLGNYNIVEFLSKITFIYSNENNPTSAKQETKQYMSIDSKMVIGFLRNKQNSEVTPVLMLLDAQNATDSQLANMKKGYLGFFDVNENGLLTESNLFTNLTWIIEPTAMKTENNYEAVYPRIQIKSNTLKKPEIMIGVKRENLALSIYKDFYIFSRDANYYITLKPHSILYKQNTADFNIDYVIQYTISTAALAVYLDALQVLKENSYPKVSYEINVISLDKDFIYNIYQRLGQIAHINDYEFKFENTLGYISEINLDLDRPWQDKIIIKNYKTKFEDLFSTIVAQTEQMKKNSANIQTAINGFEADGSLSASILADLIEQIKSLINEKITADSSSIETEYFKYEPYIKAELRRIYTEAGKVLSAAQKSVNEVDNLNIANADILGLFKTNVKENMTPTSFTDLNGKRYNNTLGKIDEDFKIGDIWKHGDYVYTATENSHQVNYNSNDVKTESLKGWSLIQDGTLAQIKGASLDINSQIGEISLLAQNNIKIQSGGSLNLAAGNVQITGNQKVAIGGPDVYIYSAGVNPNDTRGIHIYASVLNSVKFKDNDIDGTSAVDITGNGIEMRAANGIKMLSGGGIDISVSDSNSASAISLSRNNGIWLGSNSPITLYSGDDGIAGGVNDKASVRIKHDEILFGVTNGATGSAIEITNDHIVFGTSFVNDGVADISGIGSTKAGITITQEYIHMASGSDNNRSYFILDNNKLEFGISSYAAQNNTYYGSYIKMTKEGVFQVGVGDYNVTTDNSGFKKIDKTKTKARFIVYSPNFIVDEDGILYANGANVKGKITATELTIGNQSADNWVAGKGYLLETNFNSFKSTYQTEIGGLKNKTQLLQDSGKISLTAVTGTGDLATLSVDTNGFITLSSMGGTNSFSSSSNIKIGKDKISINSSGIINIDSTNFKVNSSATGTNSIFYVGNNNDKYIKYSSSNGLEVKGTITATDGSIGPWGLDENGLHIWQNGVLSGMFTQKWNSGNPTGPANNPLNNYFFMAGSGVFKVTYGGALTATSANITGTITSSTISGSTITSTASNSQVTIGNGCITLDGNWTGDYQFNAMKLFFDSSYFYMKNDGTTVIQVPIYSNRTDIPDVDSALEIDADIHIIDDPDNPPNCYNMSAPNKNINLDNVPHFKGYADNSKRANIANYADKVYSDSDKGTQVIAIGMNNWANTGIYNGNGDGNGNGTANLIFSSWYGIGFRDGCISDSGYDSITAGINCRNGAFYGSSYNNTSSYLVKENINTISNDLAKKLLLTRPVTFDYKKNKGGLKNQFGLIAEELEEIIPELVNQPETENDYKSIDYSKFVPLLIKLAQIQQDEINKLKEQLQN